MTQSFTLAFSQVFDFQPGSWDDIDLKLSESTLGSEEAILGTSEKWERLSEYNSDSRERVFSRPVGRLKIRLGSKISVCTAFLIADSQIITNNHCVPGKGGPIRNAVLAMGYYQYGSFSQVKRYNVSIRPLMTSENLDFSVLSVEGSPGKEWGTLKFSKIPANTNDRLIIIHHPAGQVKHITAFGCKAGPLSDGDRTELLHTCDTVGGSSGAPVLNQRGDVVALHFGGTTLKGDGAFNFSKVIGDIAAEIEKMTSLEPLDEVGTSIPVSMREEARTRKLLENFVVDDEFIDSCHNLRNTRVKTLIQDHINLFERARENCWNQGAISKIEHTKLNQMALAMHQNYAAYESSVQRTTDCETLLTLLSSDKENVADLKIHELRILPFCGMTEDEEDQFVKIVNSQFDLKSITENTLRRIGVDLDEAMIGSSRATLLDEGDLVISPRSAARTNIIQAGESVVDFIDVNGCDEIIERIWDSKDLNWRRNEIEVAQSCNLSPIEKSKLSTK